MTQLLKAQNSYFLEIMYLYIWSIIGYDRAKYMFLEYLDCMLLMLFWDVDTYSKEYVSDRKMLHLSEDIFRERKLRIPCFVHNESCIFAFEGWFYYLLLS